MSLTAGPPRLLWPSKPEEAELELERVGSSGPWTGPMGTPPRDGRPRHDTSAHIALRWPESIPDSAWSADAPPLLNRTGNRGTGMIVFGPASVVGEWLEGMGDSATEALNALRFGTGAELPDHWQAGSVHLPLHDCTRLIAIVNVTPDSFYEVSRTGDLQKVNEVVLKAADEGADIIDIGGESSRPGAEPLSVKVELERVIPAVELAVAGTGLPVSVDTTKAEVAGAALDAGAVVVNDISAGISDPDMFPLVAERGAGLVIMHRLGLSASMQKDPQYDDLIGEIHAFLDARARVAVEAGIERDRIAIDPGLGFGKRRRHNFEIYRRVAEFHSLGYPLLAGPSRKRHTSGPSDRPAEERLMATVSACAILAYSGVQLLRVHDAGEMRLALDTVDEIRGAIVEDRVS